MRRAVLALATLAACSSPATGHRATAASSTSSSSSSTSSTTTTSSTTSTTTATESVATPPTSTRLAPDGASAQIRHAPAPSGPIATVSWYGGESGARTANGDPYDPAGYTFASRTMAFGTWVVFAYGGRTVTAVCTDRGPQDPGRLFDLSEGTFAALAPLSAGVITVTWTVVR